ncbi:YwmB family TATA-box binding protein [Ruminiclostridium josui]|uniref:YwmB family TATA-box binding protein n=1 Tax=Ruminiclostridium josui TaxID=1499 RepID=UPI0004676DA9|nr:YwmB family TATA-box binding protein [Ruminiclostridium josui]
MRKFSFIFVAVLLVGAIIGTAYYITEKNNINEGQISIKDAFNYSGAKMLVNDVYFFARASDKYKTVSELSKVCEDVFKTLEISKYSKNTTSSDYLAKTDMQGTTKDGVKISAMASIVGNKSGNRDKYITIDATEAGDGKALLLREKIEDVFKRHKLKAEINSCITGTYEGNLKDEQLENICRKILNESSAKKIDSFRQQNEISVSAFSPLIGDKLRIGGKNVNLGIAFRYNKLENRTYLWVATPVVNAEY